MAVQCGRDLKISKEDCLIYKIAKCWCLFSYPPDVGWIISQINVETKVKKLVGAINPTSTSNRKDKENRELYIWAVRCNF